MERISCDVLIIGGGAAGSRAAVEAKRMHPELDVLLVVDSLRHSGGSTNIVASEALGINAPFNYERDGDTPEIYEQDTVQTGGGLANPELCHLIAVESGPRIQELMDIGLAFYEREEHPWQQKLSGCSKARSLTCGGRTGREIVNVLANYAQELGVRVEEKIKITQLYREEGGVVCGAYGIRNEKSVFLFAGAVILATGGAAAMFSSNVTPSTQTGDGWAMAYVAGCRFVNMEFFQCGPAVAIPGMKFIIHSHMWRFLPRLFNREGEEFLARYCKNGITPQDALDLKAMSYPFSVRTAAKYVDIAIFKEIVEGRGTHNGGVYFDVTHIDKARFLKQAPITYNTLLKAGVNLTVQPLELGITVQNFNGGILIDKNGFTGVEGLYAAGEVTGGVHGSDRPGGNNLTDTQVFGYRAGRAAADYAASHIRQVQAPEVDPNWLATDSSEAEVIRLSEELFYRELTIVRSSAGVSRVLEFIEKHEKNARSQQLKNRLTVGRLLAQAILSREESRGTHYREDRPETDLRWNRRIVLKKGTDGVPTVC